MFSLPNSAWRDAASGVAFDLAAITTLTIIALRHTHRARRP
jgi:hypothetical protein